MLQEVSPESVPTRPAQGLSSRGILVTVDGPSGVGKSTVTALLAELLSSSAHHTLATAEPSPSPIGQLARHGTHDYHGLTLSLLVAADRYHHSATVVQPAIDRGVIVICDRSMVSALVLDRLDGVDADYIIGLYRHLPRPDLAFILTDDPAACRARAAARGVHSRFHETDLAGSIAENGLFSQAAESLAVEGVPVFVIEVAGRTADQVAEGLAEMVEGHIRSRNSAT